MAGFGLREAAHQAAVNKTTLIRAIRAGRLSASRTEGGGYVIDPAELFRVYPPRPDTAAQHGDASQPEPLDATELRIRNAKLQAENEALRTMAERERRMFEDALQEARAQRDGWQVQAERLALAAPLRERRPWWHWRRRT